MERGRPRGLRRRAALLVRPRDRGLPDRRLPRDRQGPRAARRPGGHARRSPEGARARHPPGVLDEPPRGARRARAGAPCRSPTGSSWARPTCSTSTSWSRTTAPARTSCTSPSTSCSFTPRWTRTCCAGGRALEASCQPAPGRCGRARTTTRAGCYPLGGRRRGAARVALLMLMALRGTPFLYYGDEIAMLDRPDPAEALDPLARRTGDPAQPRSPSHADAVDREAGAGFSPDGARRGCRSATSPATSRPSARTRDRRCTSCAT